MTPVFDLKLSEPLNSTTRLLAVGDVALPEGPVYGPYQQGFNRYLHPDVAAVCADKDISIADLECTLFASDEPISKFGPTLYASHKTLDALKEGRFDALTLANNHILDYGPDSMFRTREVCEKSGYRTVGIGKNLDDSGRPLILTHGALRVAVVAMAEEEFSCATATRAGAAPFDVAWAIGRIQDAKREADLVIAVVHCGCMYYPVPSPRTQRALRGLVDAGAAAVIAHHAHVIEGMEVYRGVPILYGLGNFLFPNPDNAAPPACWHIGMIARLTMSKAGVHRVECYLTKQPEHDPAYGVSPLDGAQFETWRTRLQRMNEIASSPKSVAGLWDHFCHSARWLYFSNLFGAAGLIPAKLEFVLKDGVRYLAPHYAGLFLTGMIARFGSSRKRRKAGLTSLINWMRCPTHHEAIVRAAELARDGWPLDPAYRVDFCELTSDSRW